MSTRSFAKYQGAGNDFILFFAPPFAPEKIRALCHRKFGIGADGAIFLQKDSVADFRMRIFNSDGTEAESCGNGLRCLFRFITDLGFPRQPYRIAVGKKIVYGDFFGDKVRVNMGEVSNVKQLYIDGGKVHFIDTGVPHAVLFVPDVGRVDVMREGALIRHSALFAPRGANVDFAAIRGDGSVAVRTYERGVEGETLACGTGAVAVAIAAVQVLGMVSPVRVCFPGGELEIEVGKEVWMAGEAVRVFEGELDRKLTEGVQ